MSLLNEALRKKSGEPGRPEKVGPLRQQPEALTHRKTKIYIMVVGFVLVGILGALGAIKLFYFSESSAYKPRGANAVYGRKIVEKRKPLQPHAVPAEQQTQEENPAIPLQAAASTGTRKPQDTENDRLTPEPKKQNSQVPTPAQKKSATEIQRPRNIKTKRKIKASSQTLINTRNADLFFQKALTYHRQGKLDEAAEMYRHVLEKTPQHFDALFNLAAVYIKTHAFSEAFSLLEKLQRLAPENPQVLLQLAVTQIGLKAPQRALSYLDMAENQKDCPKFEIYFHRGVAYSRLNDLNQAMVWYKRAEELHGRNPRLLFNMALVYDKRQDYPDALEYYSRFLQQQGLSSDEKIKVGTRVAALKAFQANQSGDSVPQPVFINSEKRKQQP